MDSENVNGGDGRSKRVGESKVYTRKKSFNGLRDSKEDESEHQIDRIMGLGSGNKSGSSRFDVMSGESLCVHRLEGGKEEGFFTEENRVTISLSRKTKREVRELRRKLESELNSIRSLVKKIKTKEGRKNGNGGRGGVLKRVNSEVGSVVGGDVPGSRPSDLLSVSVTVPSQNVSDGVDKEKRTPKANQFYKNSEFVLAKDKFPPAESNKKSKANVKKGELSDNRDGIRLGTFTKQAYKNCSTLLERLMKHKHGWVFNTPVNTVALGLHDYYDVIKHPMDLGTVKSRLTNNLYKTPREFAEDVRLTFRNAMTYNPAGQDVHSMAEQLSKVFEDKWEVFEAEYLRELKLAVDHGSGLPIPTSRKIVQASEPVPDMMRNLDRSSLMSTPVELKKKVKNLAQSGRTANPKKPKARDPNKRDMTLDEKQKLSASLQSLPSEKLENVVQIIKKRNPLLSQQDDEIEVDIDIVDIETLWELDRFLTNHKKNLSKNKKLPESTNQVRPEAEQNVQEKDSTPMVIGTPSSKESEDELLSPTPAAEAKNEGDDAGRFNSASSSSSGSGSSSSDSDSESSKQ